MFLLDLLRVLIITLLFLLAASAATQAQTTSFTYQGKLTDNGTAANGTYQMHFALFDAASGGNQIDSAIVTPTVQVANGIFTVNLDFGAAAFSGAGRFLQISVFSTESGSYVALSPRQPITSAPYSVKSLNATTAETSETAENSNNLGGIPANQFVLATDARLTDERNPLAGSANYIQNTTSPQAANFNVAGAGVIGGDLTVGGALSLNIVNAGTQYNIGGNRFLSNPGTLNTFVGIDAGPLNTGFGNAFFGANAGRDNTGGNGNSFFGQASGYSNQTGNYNAFFGNSTGSDNETGNDNSFFGVSAGLQSKTGSGNSFFGRLTGSNTDSGSFNTFIGYKAGQANREGSGNTVIGYNANVGGDNLVFATAIGAESVVNASDTVVIGKQSGVYNTVIRPADRVIIPGTLQIDTLGTTGGTPLCRNGGNRIAACSATLIDDGRIESFSTALKNQQAQIENQREQIRQQQILIEGLKAVLCAQNPQAEVCK